MAQEYDGIWPGPKGPTVWETQLREGLKRALNPASDVPIKPGFPGGGPLKTAAGIQDILLGLGQAVSSPVAGLLSPFAPALEASLDLPIPNPADALQGRESNTKLRDLLETVVGASNAIGDAGSELTGYDKERARELSGAGLMALAGPAAKAVPKVGAGIEGLLNKVGLTAKSDPTQRNVFVPIDFMRHRPDLEDSWLETKDELRKMNSGLIASDPMYASALPGSEIRSQIEAPFRNEIRKKTGWDQNQSTGILRYEVSDENFKSKLPFTELMQLINNGGAIRTDVPFRSIFEHPDLEAIDPTLLDLAVRFHQQESGGSFTPFLRPAASKEYTNFHKDNFPKELVNAPRGLITIGMQPMYRRGVDHGMGRNQVTAVDGLDTVIHELQHNIQQKSIMSNYGATTDWGWDNYKKNTGEVEARLAALRRLLNVRQRRGDSPETGRWSQDTAWHDQINDPRSRSTGLLSWPMHDPAKPRKEY